MSFNNGPRTVVTGLSLLVDAADPLSYPGSGTSWTDIVTGITGSLSGSITYASDFKGTLVVDNSSSVIIFPTSSGNFGTDSFTVELAFQPNQINGQHWLVAKNSGSFPSWGAFITGSSGSGRITAFFNVSSTISCSMSTPTGSIVTGSNYLVDINFLPNTTSNTIYLNSELSGSNIPNGAGSLTTTSSLFISNRNSGSSVGTPLEIFNTKLYTPRLVPGRIRQNYNSLSTRLGLSQKLSLPIIEDGLLNLYPGAAAAYSLRSLNSDYGGAAIQVRNDSNAVLNIGFTSNGDLDTIALLAHCGSGNGFVTTWYDQSGNGYDVTQATALNQPQIVTLGIIDQTNNKPCLSFNGAINSRFLQSSSVVSLNKLNLSYFGVSQVNNFLSDYPNAATILAQLTLLGAWSVNVGPSVASQGRLGSAANVTSAVTSLNQRLIYANQINTTASIAVNNSALVTNAASLTNYNTDLRLLIGRISATENRLDGTLQELILYTPNQSSNQIGISTNINDFYSIY